MAIQRYEYFYDEQIRRFLLQIVRAFSGFQYSTGVRDNKPAELKLVPCIMAKRNRQAAAIARNNSQNTLLSVPMITVDLTNFQPNRDQLQNPNFVETIFPTERSVDTVNNKYTSNRGNAVAVERLMPRPFVMTVQIDIWTSTMDQKFQLLEQISTMMFPSFDIQNSDNAVDWSALTTMSMEDITLSSITVPVGTGGENEIDVLTYSFKLPMWLNPPALIHKQTLIEQIVTNIRSGDRNDDGGITDSGLMVTNITTPENHSIYVEGGYLTLLGPHAQMEDDNGNPYSWAALFDLYRTELLPSESVITLRSTISDDTSNDVWGTVQPTSDVNILSWQPNLSSLPSNTLPAINGVIDPLYSFAGENNLPAASNGQRYLLNGDMAGPSIAWGDLTARKGSIIQYQNNEWVVSFDPVNHTTIEYVLNSASGKQLKWNPDEQEWTMALEGVYSPGFWRMGQI